jgi:hypothetical protein
MKTFSSMGRTQQTGSVAGRALAFPEGTRTGKEAA